jgi:predicted small metal-binding protein
MKTMTCRQMGGPCDVALHGETADEIMDKGTKHIQESGDKDHKKVLDMMEDMQKNPDSGKEWNDTFKKKFAQLPED